MLTGCNPGLWSAQKGTHAEFERLEQAWLNTTDKLACSSFLISARCSGMQAQNSTMTPASHSRFQASDQFCPKQQDYIGNNHLLREIKDTQIKLRSVI